ncbi:WXG100 family type VII secretion target [Paenibacillus sp. FSL K6-4396]|uniref:WXG100 family type VII secretion target n=1 Tax=unclassified Paenibacillus TaxID=185978 RepID=UPI00177D69B7|nr:WXG100 family type VII secretion target [Paenibacillus sp. CFBP 13594]MBD8841988.1 WXG100 family type VII secretion target [Paenibacillus sp. CFBP 13594]
MSTIKVTPEQLHHVSNQVDQARQQLESIRSDLTRQIMFVQMMWMGATQERFYYEFEQSRPILDKALESMVNTSKELKDIATRFQDADAQKGSLGGAFGAVGAAAMMTKSTGDSSSGDKGYRMAYNAMLGKMMPVNEKGVTDQAALQAYERDQGHLDLNRMQAVNVEPPGEDIFALQIKAFEMGIHPTTGEPVSDKYAQMMVTSLKFSQIFMAIQMVRGSMPGRSGLFKTSSSGLTSKIQNNIKKAEQKADISSKSGNDLYRRTSNTGAFKELSEPMQLRHVDKVAGDAGIGLKGVKIEIVRDAELVGKDLYGWADPKGNRIVLYPDAFSSKENLVKTLGHERIHIYQTKVFGKPQDPETLLEYEKGAYGSESSWWEYYQRRER